MSATPRTSPQRRVGVSCPAEFYEDRRAPRPVGRGIFLFGAVDAEMSCRIDLKPAGVDFGATFRAPAIFVLVNAFERGLNARPFKLSAALRFLRHLLALHQIHPGEASDCLLIERNDGALVLSCGVQVRDFSEPVC